MTAQTTYLKKLADDFGPSYPETAKDIEQAAKTIKSLFTALEKLSKAVSQTDKAFMPENVMARAAIAKAEKA